MKLGHPGDTVGQRVKRAADVAWTGFKFLRGAGFLGALRPGGIANFVRTADMRARRGPATILRLHACNTPSKLAVIDGDMRLDYRALYGRVCRLAHGLVALGAARRSTIAVMMPNCHQYLEAQAAIAAIGATVVQIGYRLKAPEVAYILENSGARVVLYWHEYAGVIEEAMKQAGVPATQAVRAGGAPGPGMAYETLLSRGDDRAPPPIARGESEGSQGGVMVYTSGTTGKPKGAHRDFEATGVQEALHFLLKFPLSHEDRHLAVCPLYHSAAPFFTGMTFLVGGTVVLERHFEPEQILGLIARERVTSSMMVPTMLNRLVGVGPEVLARHDTRSLRWLMSGAAPLPTDLARRVEEAFGPILYNFYGATETGLVTVALPGEHTARPGTIGRAVEGNLIRLVHDGREVGVGEVGELWVKNSMLVGGYHRNERATSESRRDGFFFVGDLARRDADGYYYLADRKNDMVISGGVNIYPLEIEQHLHTHPAISDVAVVGVPDPDWGESLRAFVVLRPGFVGDDALRVQLKVFCKDAMADYKCPRRFDFVETLPRNPTGKVLKRELRDRQ